MANEITFFGAIDRKGHRADEVITSSYPGWMMNRHIENMEVQIADEKRRIKTGMVPQENIMDLKNEIELKEERLKNIKSSRPKLTAKQKDELANLYVTFGKEIGDSMFSRSEMNKGLASPHEELRRQKEPIIKVGNEFSEMLKGMDIHPVNGKLSRDMATKAFKIAGAYLGEETNAESLRKDFKNGTFSPGKEMEEIYKDLGLK